MNTPAQHTNASYPPYTATAGAVNRKKLLGIALVFLAACGVGMYLFLQLLANTLPDDPLYGFKTTTEKVFGGIQLTNTGRIEHNISMLEARVNELNRYVLKVSSSSPEKLQQIATASEDHTKDALNTLAGDQSIDAPTRINLLARIDATLRAEETLSDMDDTFTPIKDSVGSNENRVNDALRTAVTDFVGQNATDTIEHFIAEKITGLTESIKTIAPGSSAAKVVAKRVQDITEAITDQKYKDAIIAIIHAEQAVAIDGYLFAAERGPVAGVPVNNGPIPEGN
jgi:hypothetical protein